ncbi:hypothetical protein JCM10207_005492 [Rhodosporidiobolus poonsookiae]
MASSPSPLTSPSSTGDAVPTPRETSYSNLPSPPIDLTRLRGSSAGSRSFDPQYPFPLFLPPFSRTGSAESLSEHSPQSPTTPPTWPDPSSYSFQPTSRAAVLSHTQTHHHRTGHPSLSASISHALKPRSLLSSKLTRFEVKLVDRLAKFLEQDKSIESIREASGVISADLVGERGQRKFVCLGSASAVNKARQLVDARLSQTPIRIRLSVRLPTDSPFTLFFVPTTSSAREHGVSTLIPTHRLVYAPALAPPPSPTPPPAPSPTPAPAAAAPAVPPLTTPRRPPLGRRTASGSHVRSASFQSFSPLTQLMVGPRSASPDATPSSERSGDSFFSALSSPSVASNSSASASAIHLLGLSDSQSGLPQVGHFETHREQYVEAVVDELEACVARRSLVRVKVIVGQQAWLLHETKEANGAEEGQGYALPDLEGWKVDASRSFATPHFDYSMSRETIFALVDRLERKGFEKTKANSRVHILHLDRHRAVYAVATASGHDMRNLPPGQLGSGTLSLQKCSTLPSKPFTLSITMPGKVELPGKDGDGEPRVMLKEGSDMRVKVLADKAATSPSNELSAAMQQATWDVDSDDVFHVNVKLDPARFSESQTSIRWAAKERWEKKPFRATVSENRHHGSAGQVWELDLASQRLKDELADCSLNQLRKRFDRERVTEMVGELIAFAEELVDGVGVEVGRESAAEGKGGGG